MPSKRVSLKGKGADLFFGEYSPNSGASSIESVEETADDDAHAPIASPETQPDESWPETDVIPIDPVVTSSLGARQTRSPRSSTTSTLASKRASASAEHREEIVEAIRKVVKVPGKEVSFTRLTPEEKAQITDIVYSFKRQGQKTTENEINRIALNFLLSDYHANGEDSVLASVVSALLA